VPFPTDWLDTVESQALLDYQKRDLSHYIDDMTALLGARQRLTRLFRPIVRAQLLRKSPYFQHAPAPVALGGPVREGAQGHDVRVATWQ
jgi:hypothetical protein